MYKYRYICFYDFFSKTGVHVKVRFILKCCVCWVVRSKVNRLGSPRRKRHGIRNGVGVIVCWRQQDWFPRGGEDFAKTGPRMRSYRPVSRWLLVLSVVGFNPVQAFVAPLLHEATCRTANSVGTPATSRCVECRGVRNAVDEK